MSTKPPLLTKCLKSNSTNEVQSETELGEKQGGEWLTNTNVDANQSEINSHINSLPPNFDSRKFIKIPLRRTTSPRKLQCPPPRAITFPELPLHLLEEEVLQKKSASCVRSSKHKNRGITICKKGSIIAKNSAQVKESKLLSLSDTNFYCCIDYSAIPIHCLNSTINSPPLQFYNQTINTKRKSNKNNSDNQYLVEILISKYSYISEVIELAITHLVKEEYIDQFMNCKLTRKDQEVSNDQVVCNYFKKQIPVLKLEIKPKLPITTIRFTIEGSQSIYDIKVSPESTVYSAICKILKKLKDMNLFHLLEKQPHQYRLYISENARLGYRTCLKGSSLILSDIGDTRYPLLFARSHEISDDRDTVTLRIIDESELISEEISFNLNITVRDALIKTLAFFPSENSFILDDFGLYHPPTSSKDGFFLPTQSSLKCCKLKHNDVIELQKRHVKVPILLPNEHEIFYKCDQFTSVKDCLHWIDFNYHLQMDHLALFVPNGPMVNEKRSLLSAYISKSGFVLKQRLEGLLIFYGNDEKFVDVPFDEPFRDILPIIFTQFGINHHVNLRYVFLSLNSGMEVDINESLLDQNISYNSCLILKLLNYDNSSSIDQLSSESLWREKVTPKLSESSSITYPVAGNLNQLVIYVTRVEKTHPSVVSAFLMTYRTFTTPKMLFAKLVERYLCPPNEPQSSIISRRVIQLLKKWLREFSQDFDHSLSQQIVDFVDDILTSRNRKAALTLRKFILQRSCRIKLNFRAIPYYSSKLGINNNLFTLSSVFKFDDESIANQLTLLDFQTYNLITPLELLGQPWNKERMRHLSPNVNALIDRFNKLTMWVSTLIVQPMRRKERAKRWSRLIKIATHLRKLNNYFSLMAFISGMSQTSVTRLKYTKKTKEMRNSIKQLQELESLMDASYSFKNYRSAISNLHSPAIICLSVELKDITFIEDANPDLIDGKINFVKRMLLYESISKILYFQQYDYPHKQDDKVAMYLRDIFYLDDMQLYELSLKREPKGADKSSIL